MSFAKIMETTRKGYIIEKLQEEIESGLRAVGSKLEPMRDLACKYQTSSFTVQKAIQELAERGYVTARHGSGVIVAERQPELTIKDTAMLCLDTRGHVFGDLYSMLTQRLQELGILPLALNSAASGRDRMALRAIQSDAGIFVAHGNAAFPAHLFERPMAAKKMLVGIIEWEHPSVADKLHLVLENHAAGGCLVAQRLWEQGHRRALLIGTESMIYYLARDEDGPCHHGRAFRKEWTRLGGGYFCLVSDSCKDPHITVDAKKLGEIFTQPEAPTAVFGLRDVEVVAAKAALRSIMPELIDKLEWIGYGNTPWSYAAEKPFSTVDWNLEKMADSICDVIVYALSNPKAGKRRILIEPKLLVR